MVPPGRAGRARRRASRQEPRMRAGPPRRRRPDRRASAGPRARPSLGTPPPASARARAGYPRRPRRPPRPHTPIRQCPPTQNAGPAEHQHTRPGSCVQPSPRPETGPNAPSPLSPPRWPRWPTKVKGRPPPTRPGGPRGRAATATDLASTPTPKPAASPSRRQPGPDETAARPAITIVLPGGHAHHASRDGGNVQLHPRRGPNQPAVHPVSAP
jgi:hypothetical protein